MGPRAGLDRCGKSRPHRDSIPWAVQPVASRYNICIIYFLCTLDVDVFGRSLFGPMHFAEPHSDACC